MSPYRELSSVHLIKITYVLCRGRPLDLFHLVLAATLRSFTASEPLQPAKERGELSSRLAAVPRHQPPTV